MLTYLIKLPWVNKVFTHSLILVKMVLLEKQRLKQQRQSQIMFNRGKRRIQQHALVIQPG